MAVTAETGPGLGTKLLQRTAKPFEELVIQLQFYGRTFKAMPAATRYRGLILGLISDITIGVGAIVMGAGMFFVIFSMAFFTGTQVGLEGFQGLQQIGAEAFVGLVSSWANTREITPLVAGVALSAQVGAGYTAEIGAARISEEIDALEVMAVPSMIYMVATRIWAALLTMIPLYLAALFSSYLATQAIVTKFFQLSSGTYTHYFHLFLPATDIFYSLIKAMVFAVVVTLIHTYYGYNASGGPVGVGIAVGQAVRTSLIVVVTITLFISLAVYGASGNFNLSG